jgi:hypothetical protein
VAVRGGERPASGYTRDATDTTTVQTVAHADCVLFRRPHFGGGAEIWAGYQDRWDQLGTDARAAQVLLPGWMREAMDRVALPPDHPWEDRERIPEWPAVGVDAP